MTAEPIDKVQSTGLQDSFCSEMSVHEHRAYMEKQHFLPFYIEPSGLNYKDSWQKVQDRADLLRNQCSLTTYTAVDKLSRMAFALTVLLTLSLICTRRRGMDDSLAK